MNLGQIEDGFFVSPQLMPEHLGDLAAQGVKTIINNRPDGERGFYPADAKMAELAAGHGMGYHFIPVNLMGLTIEPIKAFENVLREASGPIVAYCASGQRSTMIWALASATRKTVDEIITACAAQGHDLSQMRPMLMQMARAA